MIYRRVVAGLLALLLLLIGNVSYAADDISDGQWYHTFLDTSQAHAITQGEGITVAVVDSGVDLKHPALTGSVSAGNDFTSPGDGTTDIDGHGTGMAGLIAAHGRVTGIAPKAKIMAVRVATIDEGDSATTAQGMLWALSHGVKIISVSSGGGHPDSRLEFAVREAAKADAVVIAAVGNQDLSSTVGYPAGFPGVLAVAGLDKAGNRASFSVAGPEVVIAAPGADVSRPGLNGSYNVASGTSNATAIVAGAVALIRAKHPHLKAADVIRLITSTATDKGAPGRDNEYGYGVLNLVGALTAELPAPTTAAPTNSPKVTPSAPVEPEDDGFPWWLIAIPVAVILGAAVIIGAILMKRRR